jgi:hypothetical protein
MPISNNQKNALTSNRAWKLESSQQTANPYNPVHPSRRRDLAPRTTPEWVTGAATAPWALRGIACTQNEPCPTGNYPGM